MILTQTISPTPFNRWLWQTKENIDILKIFSAISLILFIYLKIIYPYPNFMPPDSYSYLEAASNNDFINMWAIGYSKFLRFIGFFSKSHLFLVTSQFLLFQFSILFFLFTIRYILAINKKVFITLLAICLFNPLLLHINNFVSSDSLFTSLSLLWFTQLVWILSYPNLRILVFHAIVILLAFMTRHNAMFYPLISLGVITISSISWKLKFFANGLIVITLFCFIGITQHVYNIKSKTIQYSAFGGWQLAANALYGYAHAHTISIENVPKEFKNLHEVVNNHMDSIRPLSIRPDSKVGIYYLWDFKSPLRTFMDKRFRWDTSRTFFYKWAYMGPIYSAYGRYLIFHDPVPFVKYYIWPNLQRYYAPPLQFMGMYNLGKKTADSIAVTWFGWKDNTLPTLFQDRQINILKPFPTIISILNPLFLLSIIAFSVISGFKKISIISNRVLILGIFVWFANMAFSVFAAPIEIRYQLFSIVLTVCFSIIIFYFIIKELSSNQLLNKISQKGDSILLNKQQPLH